MAEKSIHAIYDTLFDKNLSTEMFSDDAAKNLGQSDVFRLYRMIQRRIKQEVKQGTAVLSDANYGNGTDERRNAQRKGIMHYHVFEGPGFFNISRTLPKRKNL